MCLRKLTFFLPLFLMTLFLAACPDSDDDDSSAGPTSSPGPETPSPAFTPTATPAPVTPTPFIVEPPTIEIDTTPIQFGRIAVGQTSEYSLEVGNSGEASLSLAVFVETDAGGDFALVSGIFYDISSGKTATLTLRFTPQAEEISSGSLVISANDPLNQDLVIELHGEGYFPDADEDGFTADSDCDDGNPAINPDATEVCDEVDNDCDTAIDEDLTTTFYPDSDADGYGLDEGAIDACTAPEGYASSSGDCADDDASVYPGASEQCDGVDNDCNGQVDDAVASTDYYPDGDGDGYGAGEAVTDCRAPDGFTALAGDCDDEVAEINPDATELCNGIDDNCDGTTDEGVLLTFYLDADSDGAGDSASSTEACEVPDGYVPGATEGVAFDCDDSNPAVNPGATELCDDLDNDCNNLVDDGLTFEDYFEDVDDDGWGTGDAVQSCQALEGSVKVDGDCKDDDASIHPEATETCNGLDDNCDGTVDEGVLTTYYLDEDGDGYGVNDDSQGTGAPERTRVPVGSRDSGGARNFEGSRDFEGSDDAEGTTVEACERPEGYALVAGDCNDGDETINPAALEVCDHIDNDCDAEAPEGGIDEGLETTTYYRDEDGDQYGTNDTSIEDCAQAEGYVAQGGDCVDDDPAINPDAEEACDEIDNNCNGQVDEGVTTTYYPDGDGDLYGDSSGAMEACAAPAGYVTADSETGPFDCDDTDPRNNPGLEEACDGADNNCNETVDESCTYYTPILPTNLAYVEAPDAPGACGWIGEMYDAPSNWTLSDLPAYMAMLTGEEEGLSDSVLVDSPRLDWSIRCGSDYTASPGNFSPTTPWPVLSPTGSYGGARFRGYFNIRPEDPLDITLGLLGNDALALYIQGEFIVGVNWADGRWKKFRYLSFPGPGLYTFEVQWLTNLICDIDPFEIVWADGFLPGYENYDTMCGGYSCTYNNNQVIPGFSIVADLNLVQTSDGRASSCVQCTDGSECEADKTCNSAGLCE